ncbi:hypothetical protein BCR42DRAFT_128805 [Absidia repens]|uniref:SAP domain-containing protein n=1 Tax=Absidia repens TaxID=90262 RepID=A0A1X2IVP8_9FUNG|nr:hypothetical protein BCR42DRAFT_128805 [Absidia repens]
MAESIDPKSLRVVDLKEELGKRNLAKTGKKDELVARLTEALATEAEGGPEAVAPVEGEVAVSTAATGTVTTDDALVPPVTEEVTSREQAAETHSTTDFTQHEPPKAIEQQIQSNDVVEPKSLDASAPIETTTKSVEETTAVLQKDIIMSSEDSTKSATSSATKPIPSTAPESDQTQPHNTGEVSKLLDKDAITDDQESALKRKRDELVQDQEDKRSKTESTMTKEPSPSMAHVEETADQTAICIKGFVRPLITKHLQEFIKQYGEIKRFWIDPIKTHCYIIYETLDQAANAFESIDGTVYPPNTGKQVTVLRLSPAQASTLIDREQQVADNHGRLNWEKLVENVLNNQVIDEPSPAENSPTSSKRRLGGLEQITRQLQQRGAVSAIMDQEQQQSPSILDRLSTSNTRVSMPTPTTATSQITIAGASKLMEGKSLDDLFLKTKAHPPLYYLPVDKKSAENRLESMRIILFY